MDIRGLKRFLSENPSRVKTILEELNCHHIELHRGSDDEYITCGNPDGDNRSAVTVYLTPSLLTINYTREICSTKSTCDLIDLVMFYRGESLFECLKWITKVAEVNYYQDFGDEPRLLRMIRKWREELSRGTGEDEDETPVRVRDRRILTYYFPYVNDVFYQDGISYGTQAEFQVGYDPYSHRITIPVFDEIGNLVGVKGRWFDRKVPTGELKYVYLEPCPRNKILFGYDKTRKYIDGESDVFLVEGEKGVMQFWSYGIRNVVATGGTKVSQNQIDKLSRLGKRIVICFDEDFGEMELQALRNKFLAVINVAAVIDRDHILKEKQSPSDDRELLEDLLKNHIYKIERKDNEIQDSRTK